MTSVSASRVTLVNEMRALFAGLLVILATALYAAEPASNDADAGGERAAEQTAAPEDLDAAVAEEIRAAEEAAANAPPPDPNESFVPSVQISEDLSVSFPVDI